MTKEEQDALLEAIKKNISDGSGSITKHSVSLFDKDNILMNGYYLYRIKLNKSFKVGDNCPKDKLTFYNSNNVGTVNINSDGVISSVTVLNSPPTPFVATPAFSHHVIGSAVDISFK